jgi:hypothetical protein
MKMMENVVELLAAAAAALAATRGRSSQMSTPTTMARPLHASQQQHREGVFLLVVRMVTPASWSPPSCERATPVGAAARTSTGVSEDIAAGWS